MHNYPMIFLIVLMSIGILCPVVRAEEASDPDEPANLVKASMRTDRAIVQTGEPIWVDFILTNLTSESLSLVVPEIASLIHDNQSGQQGRLNQIEMGLPLAHVFSGIGNSAVSIKSSSGEQIDGKILLKHENPVPEVILSPYGSVGLRVELTQYYKMLIQSGTYQLIWRPYEGILESAPLTIEVMAERQAVLLTDYGKIVIRFYYDKAPNHVHNFIELIKERFYDELTFHRVVPGGIIQGGCPRGDGFGIRKDEKRLKAEFSDIPFVEGTVGMARTPSDPDSASCQFFISLSRQPSFDGKQTAFGYVVGDASLETIRKISEVPTNSQNKPDKPVYIRSISLENIPPSERTGPVVPLAGGSRKKGVGEKKNDPSRFGKARHISRRHQVSGLPAVAPSITATKPASTIGQ
ncbi:MAG: peptidylprolyl isomerase [Planctomycetota bacterium]|nr:MAG: peptidylprolyl isomerase [Planctomycetota bacterium]